MATAELSDEQLVHNVLSRERDLVRARFKHSMNQLENTAELKVLRRDIARMRTEARRREIEQGLTKDGLFAKHRSSFSSGDEAAPEAAADKGGFLSGIVDKLSGSD